MNATAERTARTGFHITSADAQIIGTVFEQIQAKHGEVTPERVVAEARMAKSPLHRYFEWDAQKAHDSYLRLRAGYLIRSVTIVIEDVPVREYVGGIVRTPMAMEGEEERKVFVPMRECLSVAHLRAQEVQSLYKRLRGYRNEMTLFPEFAPVVVAIDEVGRALGMPMPEDG